jgi:hypothetical protein
MKHSIARTRAANIRWSRATKPDQPLSAEQAGHVAPSSAVSFNPHFYASGLGIVRPVRGKPRQVSAAVEAELGPRKTAKVSLSIPPWEARKDAK